MRFTAVLAATAFGAFAVASEQVQIKDFSLRDNNGIQSASFTVQPANIQCSSTSASELASNGVVVCGTSDYRFSVKGANSQYDLTVIKQTAPAFGIQGTIKVQPYCHAGGNGQNDFVCTQTGDISGVIY